MLREEVNVVDLSANGAQMAIDCYYELIELAQAFRVTGNVFVAKKLEDLALKIQMANTCQKHAFATLLNEGLATNQSIHQSFN